MPPPIKPGTESADPAELHSGYSEALGVEIASGSDRALACLCADFTASALRTLMLRSMQQDDDSIRLFRNGGPFYQVDARIKTARALLLISDSDADALFALQFLGIAAGEDPGFSFATTRGHHHIHPLRKVFGLQMDDRRYVVWQATTFLLNTLLHAAAETIRPQATR